MGGDHKCPLCSATFTRPQHVGRHMRAHTGDRPYECKDCPLRFARSDLLSRHVNKAHPKTSAANSDRKGDRKGRRRSSVSTNLTASASTSLPRATLPAQHSQTLPPNSPEPTPFQAQRMYPNHPLLHQSMSQTWGDVDMASGSNFQVAYGSNAIIADPMMFNANNSTVHHGLVTSEMTATGTGGTGSFDLGHKKRACDQCNHSKVRCDFAEPCSRCTHRSVQCTYNKQVRRGSKQFSMATKSLAFGPSQSPSTLFSSLHADTSGIHRTQSPHSYSVGLPFSLAAWQTDETKSSNVSGDSLHGVYSRPPVPDPQWDTMVPRTGVIGNNAFMPSPRTVIATLPTMPNAASPSSYSDSDQGNLLLPTYSLGTDSFTGCMGPRPIFNQLQPNHTEMSWSAGSGMSFGVETASDEGSPANDNQKTDGERRSSATWASTFNELHIEDAANADSGMDSIPFPAPLPPDAQRHASLPELDVPHMSMGLPNDLWKLFGDPMGVSTPERLQMYDGGNNETPRPFPKSNSMPDLTTPPIDAVSGFSYPFSTQASSIHHAEKKDDKPKQDERATEGQNKSDGQGETLNDGQVQKERPGPEADSMNKWKSHIQQRHATFNIQLDPSRAHSKTQTQALMNATFASGRANPKAARPGMGPIVVAASLDQTLAPQRLPSFGGSPSYDPFGCLFTPGGILVKTPGKTPRTPTSFFGHQSPFDRPGNKRQASHTLLQRNLKRAVFSVWDEETMSDESCPTSRRGSATTAISSSDVSSHASTSTSSLLGDIAVQGSSSPAFTSPWPISTVSEQSPST